MFCNSVLVIHFYCKSCNYLTGSQVYNWLPVSPNFVLDNNYLDNELTTNQMYDYVDGWKYFINRIKLERIHFARPTWEHFAFIELTGALASLVSCKSSALDRCKGSTRFTRAIETFSHRLGFKWALRPN